MPPFVLEILQSHSWGDIFVSALGKKPALLKSKTRPFPDRKVVGFVSKHLVLAVDYPAWTCLSCPILQPPKEFKQTAPRQHRLALR